MKCAAEMAKELMIVQKQKAQEKAREEYEKVMKLAKMDENSINFCETEISQALQKAIKQGQNHCYIRLGTGNSFDEFPTAVYKIRPDDNIYANGTKSYDRYGDPMNLSTIKQYMESQCFEVSVYGFTYMKYFEGKQHGFCIRVSLPDSLCCQRNS